jgi:hypothetical protein
MDQLKPAVAKYLDVTKKLNEVNMRVNELRDQRRTAELDLAAVYGTVREELPSKIELVNSHMVFVVKQPGEWKNSWNMGRKQLDAYLREILGEQRGKEVFAEIVKRHEPKLVGDDFKFELKSVDTAE